MNKSVVVVVVDPKSRNDGTVERWTMERWKYPKRWNPGTVERRKISPNPKRRNGGKSLGEILKDGMTENHPL